MFDRYSLIRLKIIPPCFRSTTRIQLMSFSQSGRKEELKLRDLNIILEEVSIQSSPCKCLPPATSLFQLLTSFPRISFLVIVEKYKSKGPPCSKPTPTPYNIQAKSHKHSMALLLNQFRSFRGGFLEKQIFCGREGNHCRCH